MAIVLYDGHTNRAKKWFDEFRDGNIWFVVGQKTPWEDEEHPPVETEDEQILDPIVYKRVEQAFYVVQDDEGSLVYRNNRFRIVNEDNIYLEHCRWVLMYAYLNYDEAPIGVGYRKIGLTTGLTKADPTSASYVLLPSQVADPGILEVIANDTVTVRSANKREKLAILVEF